MLLYQLQNLLDTEIYSFVWNIVTGVCLYLDTVQHISQGMWRGCITENKCWTHSHGHLFFFLLGTEDNDANQICTQNGLHTIFSDVFLTQLKFSKACRLLLLPFAATVNIIL